MKFFGIEITNEQRSDLNALDDRWYTNLLTFPRTSSGAIVTPDTSIRLTAVWCAVKIISEAIASLPLHLYERKPNNGKDRNSSHFLFPVLAIKPNNWQTRFEFVEQLTTHVLLRGNGYAQIVPTKDGELAQLIPLDPDRMEPKPSPRGLIKYYYRKPDGTTRVFQYWQILHVRGMSLDGVLGLSPIEQCREAIGLTASAEEYSSRFYSNDATPGGVLEHPGKLDDKTHSRIKQSWIDAHSGPNKSHKPAILEEGMQWKSIAVSARDAQFIEARKFQITEIARIFNLPPHFLKDLDNASFSNIENQDLAFLKHSIRPWLTRWEQALHRDVVAQMTDDVVPGTRQPKYFFEFKTDGLLRGDAKTRNQSYAIALQWGWHSINEVRAMENLNPIDGGDIHLAPLNMVPIEKLPAFGEKLVEGAGDDPTPEGTSNTAPGNEQIDDDATNDDRSVINASWDMAFQKVFEDTIGRLHRREQKELDKIKRQNKSILDWSEKYYEKNTLLIRDSLLPVVTAFLEQVRPGEGYQIRALVDLYVEEYVKFALSDLRSDGGFRRNRTKFLAELLVKLVRNHDPEEVDQLVNGVENYVN